MCDYIDIDTPIMRRSCQNGILHTDHCDGKEGRPGWPCPKCATDEFLKCIAKEVLELGKVEESALDGLEPQSTAWIWEARVGMAVKANKEKAIRSLSEIGQIELWEFDSKDDPSTDCMHKRQWPWRTDYLSAHEGMLIMHRKS